MWVFNICDSSTAVILLPRSLISFWASINSGINSKSGTILPLASYVYGSIALANCVPSYSTCPRLEESTLWFPREIEVVSTIPPIPEFNKDCNYPCGTTSPFWSNGIP